ncbi:hypothetical protein [Limosilactobacillus fastidiosus]|uniref:Uncharacterized protein n=1 Tax=Limosilactobacillus fastidiosus TaxID=2759855 RepID=A0A7W3YB79_9LACO|nr:hypothetical protein [Limosilactobacillus fastidiosus]MBB1063205.1 hypothetical protein [Limosilactobacillus fastidiosus]MBB1085379.1 hypothetical protein [Limosilactobacillus fastidiosus]MCD7083681.1 hypothetical protein [Limosilactobacillus fastidiosus]MCD7085361.1 hypothetical protein [Limosilactobacillus fastidiosus]MCD7114874.1 hypothetical protein [Limosilactobacillus fastidiosus]
MERLLVYGTQFICWCALCFGLNGLFFYMKRQHKELEFCLSKFTITGITFTLIVFLSLLGDRSLFREIIVTLDKPDNIIFILVVITYILNKKISDSTISTK